MSFSACVVLTMVAILVVSAGTGNGAQRTVPEPGETRISLSAISGSVVSDLESVRLTILSWRLRTVLKKMAAVAPEVERKLAELSQVVQGGLCGGLVAELQQVCDVPGNTSVADLGLPGDPEDTWRYANRLADEYLPLFEECLRCLRALRPHLVAVGPAPMKRSMDLLFESCELQLDAARSFVRALGLVRDCDGMTVGQALELVQAASSGMLEGSARLDGAFDSIAFID